MSDNEIVPFIRNILFILHFIYDIKIMLHAVTVNV